MPASPGHREPSPDEIRGELSRILESAEFVASNQLTRFFRYVVEESLAGRADSIKERNVAVQALQRDSTFNPRKDPIVRILAGRLRRALTRFYGGNEVASSVRIDLPKGAYRPRFRSADVTDLRDSAFIASAGQPVSSDDHRTRRPVLVVVPFVAFSRGAFERQLADSIAQDMSVHLSRFSWFEVADFLMGRNLPSRGEAPAAIASRLHADYFLSGTIRKHGCSFRVTVQLADATLGRIIWAEPFTLHADDEELSTAARPKVLKKERETSNRRTPVGRPGSLTAPTLVRQDDIVERVTARLGDVYGVLATTVLRQARRKPLERITLCENVLANLRYQLHLADSLFANAFQSAQQAIVTDPEFAWAWAALGLLYVDNLLFSIDHRESEAAESALFCIRQALTADPECGLAHFTQGVYHLAHGEVEQCIAAAERTVEFAHGSPFETAGGGGLLAMVGEGERSEPLVDWAINNNPGLPGWVHWAAAANHFQRGEYQRALLATQRFSLPECFWDHLFRAAARVATGDDDHAKRSLRRALQLRPILVERRREMVTKLVLEPGLRKLLMEELPHVE